MLTKPKPRSGRTVSLLEYTTAPPLGRVDRENGVIRGVKILGSKSRNGRSYSNAAQRDVARLAEGAPVNVNHPDRSTPRANRTVEAGIGWLENVSTKSDGVYGDLCVIKSHPLANTLFDVAERNPKRFGLSINASGSGGASGLVESVNVLHSVDLVQNPATVVSLFESMAGPEDVLQPTKVSADDPEETAVEAFREILKSPLKLADMLREIQQIIADYSQARQKLVAHSKDAARGSAEMAESYGRDDRPRVRSSGGVLRRTSSATDARRLVEQLDEAGYRPARGAAQMAERYR